jgi:hypothetical protein
MEIDNGQSVWAVRQWIVLKNGGGGGGVKLLIFKGLTAQRLLSRSALKG